MQSLYKNLLCPHFTSTLASQIPYSRTLQEKDAQEVEGPFSGGEIIALPRRKALGGRTSGRLLSRDAKKSSALSRQANSVQFDAISCSPPLPDVDFLLSGLSL